MKKALLVKQVKLALLDYHQKNGYQLFNSFPIAPEDPTIMFINSTIAPFKHYYLTTEKRAGYALFQRCFRMGGTSELKLVGANPYYHTFFEMFGSGVFEIDYKEAVAYLLELLNLLTLDRKQIYFAVPREPLFGESLIANNINPDHIFDLGNTNLFWQEWRFGKLGPVGSGLTVIYSRASNPLTSLNKIIKGSDEFVELANLIHVYGQELPTKNVIQANNPGFEFGVGIERLAAVLQGCNNYQIDTILPLIELVASFFKKNDANLDEVNIRTLTDHLRAICILTDEDIKPNNKKEGYVFRKLIRRTLEKSWLAKGQIWAIEPLVEQFCNLFNQCGEETMSPAKTTELVGEEAKIFLIGIERAKRVMSKNPTIDPNVLIDTYGLPQALIPIIQKGE